MSIIFNKICINEEMLPIYTVIHRQIVSFYQNSSVWLDKLDSRSWDRNLTDKHQYEILPLSHEETSASEGNLNAYVSHLFLFAYIHLMATESSIHLKSLALR